MKAAALRGHRVGGITGGCGGHYGGCGGHYGGCRGHYWGLRGKLRGDLGALCCAHQHWLGRWRSPAGCMHKHTHVCAHTPMCTHTRSHVHPHAPGPCPHPAAGAAVLAPRLAPRWAPLALSRGCFRAQPGWSPLGHRGHSPRTLLSTAQCGPVPYGFGVQGPIQPQGSAVSPSGVSVPGQYLPPFSGCRSCFPPSLPCLHTEQRAAISSVPRGRDAGPTAGGKRAPAGGSPGHGGGPIAASGPGAPAPPPHARAGGRGRTRGQLRGGQGKRSPAGFLCYQPISRAAGTRKPLPGKQLKITRPFLGLQTFAALEATE